MTEITYCATGCTVGHLSDCADDACTGCQPRFADIGLLCRKCHGRLVSLVGPVVPIEQVEPNAESVASIATWMASNLGQHLRAPGGDGRGRVEAMDRTVDVAMAMSDLQIKFYEWAESLADDHGWRMPSGKAPGTVAWWLRSRLQQVAMWEPVAEMISDLREAIQEAHDIAPWRPADRLCVGVACPTCHHKTLRIPAGQLDVWCSTCGSTHGRDVYDRITALLAWEAAVGERLARAGLDADDLATLTQLHHALEVPKRTLERWRLEQLIEPVACLRADRSQLYIARDAFAVATRVRG